MSLKLTAIAAAAVIAAAGAASAEPFALGDAALDAVTAGGNVTFNTAITKTVDITKVVNLDVLKTVTSTVDITGSLATAEASADAINFENVLAETDVFAQVDEFGAYSFGEALAAGTVRITP